MLHHRLTLILATFAMVTAMHGQELAATLSAVDHNGYHVSCFGLKDGSVAVTVTGGTPPYLYTWSTGAQSATATGLPAGYLNVKVSDAIGTIVIKEITLTEPGQLKLVLTPFKYPSGKNISCYECFNGSVDLEVLGGVTPYSYVWNDDITTRNRTGLGAMAYDVGVEDANSCKETGKITLEQPEKATWGMAGNANTLPGSHYIGSSDNKDVVFKSNGAEVLRLKANGDISLQGSLAEEGLVYRGADGILRGLAEPVDPVNVGPCSNALFPYPIWLTRGNWFPALCNGVQPLLGTRSNDPLKIITNDVERIRITESGYVGIGTVTPTDLFSVSGSGRPSISLRTSDATSAAGSLFFRKSDNTASWELATDLNSNGTQNLYIRDKVADVNRLFIDDNGHVAIGGDASSEMLSVSGAGRPSISIRNTDANNASTSLFFKRSDNSASWEVATDLYGNGSQNFYIRDKVADVNRIYIDAMGRVAIGDVTTPVNYMLAVEKGIITDRLKVAIHSSSDWMDQVFAPNYKLMPLRDVHRYIQKEHHLPGVPSAKEMVKEGLDVAKMDALLLQKIEELTLYIIALEKRVNRLDSGDLSKFP